MNSNIQIVSTPTTQSAEQAYCNAEARVAASGAKQTCLETPRELSGKYRFIRELGHGAQSKVYLAERLEDGKKIAIKQLSIDSIKTWKEYTLFHREAEVLSTLDIPGVVKLYEACDCLEAEPPCSYIMQEYVEGTTLKSVLQSGYRFSIAQIYDLVLQIIDILEKLHGHDPCVIHRDIKPSNIILSENADHRHKVTLIDFGAVANAQVQSGGSTIAGTFGYMSPEQNIGRAEPASDTYALAALTAYLLSGVEPAEMTVKDLRLIIDPYIENHPRALVETLRSMLEPSLDRRLSDLTEIRRRFQSFKAGNYTLENSEVSLLAPENWYERLQSVHHICQPQNIEIWQDLPDQPENRCSIPIGFFKTTSRFANYISNESLGNYSSEKSKAISATFILIAPIIIFVIRSEVLILMLILFLVSYAFFIYIFKKIKIRRILMDEKPFIHSDSIRAGENCLIHRTLFLYGQKTIATITDIQFVPNTKRFFQYTDIRIEATPMYRISYKFNPPDDDTSEDLIHTITTHVSPEGRFKVGDPLPILYSMTTTENNVKHVTHSMPFPLPLSDLETADDYISTNDLDMGLRPASHGSDVYLS